jgi:hypothetical protein
VAADGLGDVLVTTDPLGGGRAWRAVDVDAGDSLSGLSCPSVSLCVGVDAGQNVVTTKDPTGGAGAWTVTHVDNAVGWECGKYGPGEDCELGFIGVACPSVSLCVGVDLEDNAVTSTDPSGGASAWSVANIPPAGSGELGADLLAPTCPSVSLCLIPIAYGSGAISSRQPDRAAGWSLLSWFPALEVSCPSTRLCVGGTAAETGVVSYDPLGGQAAWRTTIDRDGGLVDASCPSMALCVAVDDAGYVIVGTPTPSRAELRRLLAEQLGARPNRRSTRSLLRRGGYRLEFKAPSAGRLTDTWYLRTHTTAVALATVRVRFPGPGIYRLDFKPSQRARQLLASRSNPLELFATGSLTAAQGPTVHSTKTVTLLG